MGVCVGSTEGVGVIVVVGVAVGGAEGVGVGVIGVDVGITEGVGVDVGGVLVGSESIASPKFTLGLVMLTFPSVIRSPVSMSVDLT